MRTIILALLMAFTMQVGVAQAASFDCAKAVTETEKAICSDPELSALDESLSFVYSTLSEITENKDFLIKEQRDWLKSRETLGAGWGQLYSIISTRIHSLSHTFNFLKCLEKVQREICFQVFSKIATTPIPVKLLHAGDGLSVSVELDGVIYDGSYAESSLGFIYSWGDSTQVFYSWSPTLGLQLTNPRTKEATNIESMVSYKKGRANFDMLHPITNSHRNYCSGWATDTRGHTSDFCKTSEMTLWNLELDRKLKNIDGGDNIKTNLNKTMSAISNEFGRLKLMEVFVRNLPN